MSTCKPCGTFKNRLAEDKAKKDETKECVNPTKNEPEKKESTETKPQGSVSLSTIKCGKEIISITVVGDNVVVMYDDCSFSTVSRDKVHIDAFVGNKLLCVAQAVKAIDNRLQILEAKEDKDTVYDDTLIKERILALEEKEDKDTIYDDTELKNLIKQFDLELKQVSNNIPDISNLATKIELENGLNTKVSNDDLIIIENLEGTADLFKAVKLG